ncbi:MAG: YhcH/YjgK/YiaL family protein [bacterium]|nr:YhcH/YjgK/YiaL family protein [bacterium]
MIIDRLDNWRNVFAGPIWETVFTALESLGPESPEGETPLRGDDIFMRVMSYMTRPHDEAVLEAHRQYIDIQAALAGGERIEWHPAAGLEVKTPYDAHKDAVFFRPPAPAPAGVNVFPGTFAVLFPGDAHMPQLLTGARPEQVRKVVIKLRASLVRHIQ